MNNSPKKIIINDEIIQTIKPSNLSIPDIPIEVYIQAVGLKTFQSTLLDALFSTNHFLVENGKIKIKSQSDVRHIAGHVFENYIVNTIRYDFEVGRRLLQWATGYSQLTFNKNNFGYEDFTSFYFGIRTIAKASKDTKNWDTNKYSHTSKHDVEFFIPNPIKADRSICLGGFQVKAINGNEKQEIIIPLLKNEYTCVLTMLENPQNGHSYKRCMEKIREMLNNNEITYDEAETIKQKISFPEMFGIPQEIVNYIYSRIIHLERKGASIINKKGRLKPPYFHILDGLISFAFENEEKTPYIISSGNCPLSVHATIGSHKKADANDV
ncbi:hypothetical protein LAV73_03130 [Lysinibacillus xylanilyticus]|uniref:hypothetical protein n=1 Tax=Lysinibacillus xylanilyticus TaxID=582475 RepID=UPI002B249EB6|nr:hypothetical protein [Lysinibacillus xylanilyticus]MEB2278994.1 hypothetical protein [Lysinibacillus xylanilyticus]